MGHFHKKLNCEDCQTRDKGIFCGLNFEDLVDVSKNKVTNNFQRGQTLFYQGAPTFGLYCIHQGKIKVTKTGSEGKESIVRIAGPGDLLGHRSLFCNQRYTATGVALEDTTVCFMDKNFIYQAIKSHPSVSIHIIERLCREMGASETMSASMHQKSVRERIADLLLSLKMNYGVQENNRLKLDIRISRIEIASMVGTASETAIRFISELKQDGVIEEIGKTIYIVDEERLRDIAYNKV